MITIICGTNRKDAVSHTIANIYSQILDSLGAEYQYINLEHLPMDFTFSALYENSGQNEIFNRYREMMLNSEKYAFIVPEYNGSFPGVLKAFIDGLQFPDTFTAKKAALVGVSSGIQGETRIESPH
jgi:NAD(P)H-dependent FMN reductase